METKFISDLGILELAEVKISIQENNSRVSDQKFTKFMLPFKVMATEEFIKNHGDYVSYETTDLKNKIPGFLMHENKTHEAFLFIQDIIGFEITAQIDFGFEELPNYDKKLSELPLEKFSVPDIHTYAKEICTKKYPATNFNFPRIYTKKYQPTDEVWKNFDGYYNDLKKDGSEMRRNYIDEVGGIWNVNIIHPCPHPLYLLNAGFSDAGLTLEGDILTDPNLQNRYIFSGTEYFSKLTQRRLGLLVSVMDYESTIHLPMFDYPIGFYNKSVTIPKTGGYKMQGLIRLGTHRSGLKSSEISIFLNGNRIYYNSSKDNIDINISMDINVNAENSTLAIVGVRSYGIGDTEEFVRLEIFSKDIYANEESEGEDSGVITNLNEIDLKKAVPEMTFGEYVNGITNWFNYDVEVKDKRVIMNKIQSEVLPEPKDFKFMEVPLPRRTLLNKKSFLLKFPEMDEGFKKNSMYYDYAGPVLNGKEKSDTSIIEANGYAMELRLPKPLGYLTANVMKDSDAIIALVQYDGLINGQNNATYSPGCDHPELFENDWAKFLRIRINGQEYNWSKKCSTSKISQYSVRDFIFCYNNIHIIKSMSKVKTSKDFYNVEFITETVV